jgi:hypothetical protein
MKKTLVYIYLDCSNDKPWTPEVSHVSNEALLACPRATCADLATVRARVHLYNEGPGPWIQLSVQFISMDKLRFTTEVFILGFPTDAELCSDSYTIVSIRNIYELGL